MSVHRYILFPLLLALIAWNGQAQSPYQTSWSVDGPIGGGAAALGIVSLFLDDAVVVPTAEEIGRLSRESVSWLDRGATYRFSETTSIISDVLVMAIVTAPAALLTADAPRSDAQMLVAMYAETMVANISVTYISKSLAERLRPYTYNPDAPMEKKLSAEARKSFFSGHTSTAFASAVFLSTVYADYFPNSSWRPVVWAVSLAAAGTVAFLRVEAGRHFPTDVLVGALVGSAIGYAIPALHRADADPMGSSPLLIRPGSGFAVSIRF